MTEGKAAQEELDTARGDDSFKSFYGEGKRVGICWRECGRAMFRSVFALFIR